MGHRTARVPAPTMHVAPGAVHFLSALHQVSNMQCAGLSFLPATRLLGVDSLPLICGLQSCPINVNSLVVCFYPLSQSRMHCLLSPMEPSELLLGLLKCCLSGGQQGCCLWLSRVSCSHQFLGTRHMWLTVGHRQNANSRPDTVRVIQGCTCSCCIAAVLLLCCGAQPLTPRYAHASVSSTCAPITGTRA